MMKSFKRKSTAWTFKLEVKRNRWKDEEGKRLSLRAAPPKSVMWSTHFMVVSISMHRKEFLSAKDHEEWFKTFLSGCPSTYHERERAVSKRTLEKPVRKTPSNFGDSVRQAILSRENDARFRRTLVDNKEFVFYSGQRRRYEFGS